MCEKETCRCLAFSRLYHTTAVVPRFVLAFSLPVFVSLRYSPAGLHVSLLCDALCPVPINSDTQTVNRARLTVELRAVLKLQTNHSVSAAAVIAYKHTHSHAFNTCVGHTHCASARRKQCYPSPPLSCPRCHIDSCGWIGLHSASILMEIELLCTIIITNVVVVLPFVVVVAVDVKFCFVAVWRSCKSSCPLVVVFALHPLEKH